MCARRRSRKSTTRRRGCASRIEKGAKTKLERQAAFKHVPIDANNTTLWESQQRGSGDKIELYSHFTTLCDGSVAKRDVLLEDLAGRLGGNQTGGV